MEAVNKFLKRTMGWLPARVAMAAMAWLGFINLYMVRVNMSVIIVAMVGGSSSSTSNGTQAYCQNLTTSVSNPGEENVTPAQITPTTNQQEGEFDWNETIQGLVLGSFSYGYAFLQIPGGRLAEMYGVKWVFGGSILSGGICSVLAPTAARLHYGALITLRVVQGLLQGVSWPSMHACVAQWIPPLERSRFVAVVYFASTLGTALTLPLCGLLIDSLGWAATFYVTGSLSLVWCLLWFTTMYNQPAQHPRISHEELQYIESAIRSSGTSRKKPPSVPWRSVATSLPVWAIIVYEIGSSWGITLFVTQLPTFMKNILGFSIRANGALSALPFMARYVGGIVMSVLSSWILMHGYLSIVNTRRLFSVIAMLLPAVMVVGLVYAGCDWQATVVILCLALFFNGAITNQTVNHIDIAPNFCGTLLGISNASSSIVSSIVPVMTGILTDSQQTLAQWRKVFWICVPMYVVAEGFFLVSVSGSVQSWNYAEEEEETTALTTTIDTTDTIPDQQQDPNHDGLGSKITHQITTK